MSNKKNILIVDDIPEYVDAIEMMLPDESLKVEKAYSKTEAIEKISLTQPYITIIDVRLKEDELDNKEGIELLKWIKANYPQVKVIMVSAYKEFEFKTESLSSGADYFLEKPIKPSVFKEILKGYFGKNR